MSHAEPQKIIPSHFIRRLLEAIRRFFFGGGREKLYFKESASLVVT